MLTATAKNTVSKTKTTVQNETLSDVEVSRRVLAIRSRWSVGERIRRRREAEKRLGDLLQSLSGCVVA